MADKPPPGSSKKRKRKVMTPVKPPDHPKREKKTRTKKLTAKQRRFAEEYNVDSNGTQAAIRAGYSKNGADVQAVNLLGNARVKKEVERLRAAKSERTGVTADMVVEGLLSLAQGNLDDFVRIEGETPHIDFSDATRQKMYQLTEISSTTTSIDAGGDKPITETKVKIKTADKRKAWVDLGKHLGIFEKDNAQKQVPVNFYFSRTAD